ncbi:MAG: hypothetical protein ABSD47_13005 [Candidatus Methylomirabilota bacterium]|jgi:hypothetical protein
MAERIREFIRGLNKPFVDRLNEEYARGGWWTQILKDEDLYLGIRDNYLNVYYKGCSLVKLSYREGKLCGKVHYKYLLKPDWHPTYVTFKDGRRGPLGDDVFIDTLNPRLLKRTSSWYAGKEKQGVHDILRSNPNILDVEIALATADEESDRQSAKKIDFAALQPEEDKVRLVFFEAKHFTNPEVRAKGDATPRVVEQIQRYVDLIRTHEVKNEIKKSYRRVCENLCQLDGVRDDLKKYVDLVTPERPLEVDGFPRLVIFGFDEDQQVGEYWKMHLVKFEARLGKDRILTRGQPKGISLPH